MRVIRVITITSGHAIRKIFGDGVINTGTGPGVIRVIRVIRIQRVIRVIRVV